MDASWSTPASSGIRVPRADASMSVDLGTPYHSWREGQEADLTYRIMSKSPAYSPFHTKDNVTGMEEDKEHQEVGDQAADYLEEDWMHPVADLYKSTARDLDATENPLQVAQPLSEFVMQALDFHLAQMEGKDSLYSAIGRLFLLLHFLFYDTAGSSYLWPLSPLRNVQTKAAGFSELESMLYPPSSMIIADDDSFDPALCHLRRILFWLESDCVGIKELEEQLDQWFRGISGMRSDSKKLEFSEELLTLQGCSSQSALISMTSMIFWHIRRGELVMAQERCRKCSGTTDAYKEGGKLWWKAAMLEPSVFYFEPSQMACMRNSKYAEWHQIKSLDDCEEGSIQSLQNASQFGNEKISPQAWKRFRSVCQSKYRSLAVQEQQIRRSKDKSEFMLHAHDRAIFAVMAGVWPGLQTDLHDGMGGRERDDMRQELREAKILSRWEDELWFDLRRIFVEQTRKLLEEDHSESIMRQISDAVRQAGNVSQEYDEFVSRTREGDKRHKLVNTIAEIQRQVIALDLHGLFAELDKLTALESLERRSQEGTSSSQMTSLAAHLAVYFKTMLFIQGGQTLSSKGADPEKASWHAELVDVLRKIDLILERHVEMLIACQSWQEVPLILSVTLNHLVFPCRARPFAEAFNRVVQQMAQENEARVERLSILFLTSVEQNVSDSSSRRDLIKQMEFWLGSERLKKTGEEVAGQLETGLGLDVGERLKEIFLHTKQSFQAIHKAHAFLLSYFAAEKEIEGSSIVVKLIELVAPRETGDATDYGHFGSQEFENCKAQLVSNFNLLADYEEKVLKEAFAEKEAGDSLLFEYERERSRRTQHAFYVEELGREVAACLPRGSNLDVSIAHSSFSARQTQVASHSPLVRAAGLYSSSFRKLHEVLSRVKEQSKDISTLFFYVKQLARLCVWSALSDIFDQEIGSLRLWESSRDRLSHREVERLDSYAFVHMYRWSYMHVKRILKIISQDSCCVALAPCVDPTGRNHDQRREGVSCVWLNLIGLHHCHLFSPCLLRPHSHGLSSSGAAYFQRSLAAFGQQVAALACLVLPLLTPQQVDRVSSE
uniref:Uncharacterized protein n=1 Tax=Guillardia theta TaxID=55529 RepID=A0A7S4NVR7_GUITH|mmetsp:Transcript_35340/g.110468  ORF Transcript_35340/g.110468 Transcript_35340/m.110468 type:complete len:1062 (+) Transcript_35340:66-3251(+)